MKSAETDQIPAGDLMKKQMVDHCPACQAPTASRSNTLRLKTNIVAPVWCCRYCGHRWLTLTISQQKTVDDSYDVGYEGFRIDRTFMGILRRELGSTIIPLIPPPARVLDVGCGNGMFLRMAAEVGYDCRGIDLSEAAATFCQQQGMNAIAGNFLNQAWEQPFDLITMWDVVEHLREPEKYLRRVNELLVDRGHLLLKIPSFGPLNFSILKLIPSRGGLLIGAPGHINYFSRTSFVKLLDRCGFEPVKWGKRDAFRQPRRTKSIKKQVGRSLKRLVGRLAGNENIYCILRKKPD